MRSCALWRKAPRLTTTHRRMSLPDKQRPDPNSERIPMPLSLYLAFLLATTVLILIPGPNVSLIVANSIAYGTRYGLLTVAGTSAAIVVQLGLTALGLTAVLGTLAGWFDWLRW